MGRVHINRLALDVEAIIKVARALGWIHNGFSWDTDRILLGTDPEGNVLPVPDYFEEEEYTKLVRFLAEKNIKFGLTFELGVVESYWICSFKQLLPIDQILAEIEPKIGMALHQKVSHAIVQAFINAKDHGVF